MTAGLQRRKWVVCAVLGLTVLIVFSPALKCGFVNYDDPAYVISNWHVLHGLNWPAIQWAFTSVAASNWHPLTWWSHMLDCQIYGLQPAGHHLTSLLLHMVNSIFIFLLLRRLTGALWRSAIVAALFALHPLRVESVAWISERKDVLSSFFWMLAVGVYVLYAEEFKVQCSKSKKFYGLALVFFALALMAKPMVVTLPFVLLLLDCWPLRRLRLGPGFSWQPILEKIPFFVLSAACSLVTFLVQDRTGAVASAARFPLIFRLENMPVAYVRYLTRTFWPSHLASYYPYVEWKPAEIIGAVALLAGITALSLWRARTAPYFALGWFWFLGMLVPTIGLVQAGGQSLADRYSYLPSIGLWIMTVWGLYDLAFARPRLRQALALAAGVAVVVFASATWRHTGIYKDSGTLWQATLRSYPNCLPALNNLSRWFMDQGHWEEARDDCLKALAILPSDPTAHDDLSRILLHQGNVDGAIAEGLKSIQAQPRSDMNRQTLARAYLQKGDFAAAAASLKEAIKIEPTASEAWCNLGYALLQQGKIPEATGAYEKALELSPDNALAHNDLGSILLRLGDTNQAKSHFARAVALAPEFVEARYNLAGQLMASGNLDEALSQYEKVTELRPQLAQAHIMLGQLAAAYARAGHPDRAVAIATRALALTRAAGENKVAESLLAQIRVYQEAKP